MFNIATQEWDADAAQDRFGIPVSMLPDVKDCAADFGQTEAKLLGRRPRFSAWPGISRRQRIGQACFKPGMLKSTYGTGCFALLNTGATTWWPARTGLLGTIAYQFDGTPTYALEGSIFNAGTVVQWLRDGLAGGRRRRITPMSWPPRRTPRRR
jgi:glycerol kinase